jgi:antitoxin component YwqK of YwqJK toxin-antitoxin module
MKKLLGMMLFSLLSIQVMNAQARVEREIDGLRGAVKSARIERTEISQIEGRSVEKPRVLESLITYDEKGNKIEELRYDYKGSLAEKMVFSRDDKGRQVKISYKPDGKMESKWVFTFDDKGKLTGGTAYNPDGTVKLKMERIFDASGRLIEASMHNPDGSLMNKTLFKYDAEGKPTEQAVYDAVGELMQRSVWSKAGNDDELYDNNGGVRYKSVSQPPTFEFDSHENWIKRSWARTESRGDKTTEVVIVLYRTISYY